jgi:hypothetical protein
MSISFRQFLLDSYLESLGNATFLFQTEIYGGNCFCPAIACMKEDELQEWAKYPIYDPLALITIENLTPEGIVQEYFDALKDIYKGNEYANKLGEKTLRKILGDTLYTEYDKFRADPGRPNRFYTDCKIWEIPERNSNFLLYGKEFTISIIIAKEEYLRVDDCDLIKDREMKEYANIEQTAKGENYKIEIETAYSNLPRKVKGMFKKKFEIIKDYQYIKDQLALMPLRGFGKKGLFMQKYTPHWKKENWATALGTSAPNLNRAIKNMTRNDKK